MYPVIRHSRRLQLRELSVTDVDSVFAIYGSDEATEHLSFEPRTRAEVEGIVTRSIASAQAEPRGEFALAVVEKGTGDLIGFGRLASDPHQQRAATFGFALRPESWGVGYGLETVRLLLGVAFEELNLHRVWGARSPLNTASARTMAKAGMVEEGVIREHVYKAGAWRDSVVHAVLDQEWAQAKKQ
ncbi:Acetyltransferase including N-acetylase of ribosomal protein-like protein [Streptomyces albus]|uniref:Acetyltransferase including N-acetylase of ribosomal protein-like protein n=1 Tax=Streptomyces albus (strain ATCC 21838 / DSM 41398 / FERM P-419 / JCM 4703 / NBRC 107858) TaxID=1081613 RepID=A0A0B5EM18_STRA4|nr:Acetyltransferase including N-acetylase of ribosomal protein-like protein [Streptomyces albus]AOU76932.1 Acetyltransferase including N-acetylase of ribosomal protein-like protein [Streptomyces albus]AYN32710.1 N-acetyltransferase [Streptomyces albus]